MQLSASLENYLETILNLYEEKQKIKAVEIAKSLNVSKASVTEALRALAAKGLINYAPYEDISLTAQGIERAQKVTLKHQVLYDFLSGILGIEHEEAITNACKIEHVISENVLDKFIAFLEFNKTHCVEKHDCAEEFNSFYKNR